MSKITTTLYTADEGATKYRLLVACRNEGHIHTLEAGSLASLAGLIRDNLFRYGVGLLMLRIPGPQGYILREVEGLGFQAKTRQRKWADEDLYQVAVMALGAAPAGLTWADMEI